MVLLISLHVPFISGLPRRGQSCPGPVGPETCLHKTTDGQTFGHRGRTSVVDLDVDQVLDDCPVHPDSY